MSGPILLLSHSLKRVRTLLLTMGVLLGAFQIVLVLVARSIDRTGGFAQLAALLPPFVRELMGSSITAFLSFAGIVCLGYFHMVVMGSLVGLAIAVGTVPASEVETGFIDLLLSRPIPRHWIITRTIAMSILAIAAVVGMMMLGTWVGLRAFAPTSAVWPSAKLIASLAGSLGLLMLSWSGVALALASVVRRRSIAGAATGVLALAMFLLDYVGRIWQPAEKVAWVSPFRYYNAFDLVVGGALSTKNLTVLMAIAVAGFSVAYLLYSRRDLVH